MLVKIIHNTRDYNEAIEMLSVLLEKKDPSSEEKNTIELLLLVIKDFEQKHAKPIEIDPIEAIKFRMDQMNLKQKDLVPFFGTVSKVSEVLNGKRQLSLAMIRKLHEGLQIPLSSLIKESVLTKRKGIDFTMFPLRELYKRGYLEKIKYKTTDLNEYAEEIITEFVGPFSKILEQNVALLRAPLHQRGNKTINRYNLTIWQICVLKKALQSTLHLPKFDVKSINEKWLRKLITLSHKIDGHLLVKPYLEKFGISLIIEPHFPKTFIDGAAILYKGRPIIALTQRHNRVDNFWFVLAHELAHLMKHMGNDETSFFIDDLKESKQLDQFEIEADAIANEALIPHKVWTDSALKFRTYKEIEIFANNIQVNPAIIAGRIRYEKNDFTLFPKLFYPISFN